eukprot:gnl/MRDRNA2_/MRDRNA2_46090_c0_seq2.p1 gnl/MRDRNA2_/MRDRNA2_46090_c0~~gnl/MRDRNA2_/MRDRNA2_46090_c0_seq2.p1  ORF type:complete len:120 (+),score=10.95 gnl/MRDRNA2_/MRDRNA2_46090_c0_seq2:68-427(+)
MGEGPEAQGYRWWLQSLGRVYHIYDLSRPLSSLTPYIFNSLIKPAPEPVAMPPPMPSLFVFGDEDAPQPHWRNFLEKIKEDERISDCPEALDKIQEDASHLPGTEFIRVQNMFSEHSYR